MEIERRARLDLQIVEGNVLRIQPYQITEIPHQAFLGLTGNTEHEIDVYVGKPRLAGNPVGLFKLGSGVNTRERAQLVVVPGLKPDRNAVYPAAAQLFEGMHVNGRRI